MMNFVVMLWASTCRRCRYNNFVCPPVFPQVKVKIDYSF